MARKLRLRRRREAADSKAQKVLQGMSDVAHDKKKIEDQLEVMDAKLLGFVDKRTKIIC